MAGPPSLFRSDKCAALAALGWLVLCAPCLAQAPVAGTDTIATEASTVDSAAADLHSIMMQTRAKRASDDDLKAREALIPPLQARLSAVVDTLAPKVTDIDARLAQLGPAPSPGQPPEDPENAATRRALVRFRGQVDAELKQARLLGVEAGQEAKALADQLRGNFAARVWTQSRSILDPTLWRDFFVDIPPNLARLRAATNEESRLLAIAARSPAQVVYWLLAGLSAIVLLGPARALLNRYGARRAEAADGSPTPLRRSGLAVWRVMVATSTPLMAGIIIRAAFLGAMTAEFQDATVLSIRVVVFAALLGGLGKAVLSPRQPQWRLAPLSDEVARRLGPFPALIGMAAGVATLTAGVNSIFAAALPTSIAVDCLTVIAEIAVVGGALTMVGRARTEQMAQDDVGADARSRVPWVLAALAAWLALAAALLAVLTGFLALASFLMHETIWVGSILAATFLLLRFVDALFPALLSPQGSVGLAIKTAISLSDGALEQTGVLMSGLARIGLLLLGWTIVLAPFGASTDDIIGRITATSWLLQIGQVSISPGAIFGALALFLIGLMFTGSVRRWLETRYLPKTGMDVGVRTSLAAAVSYGGVILAVLLTFAYLGLSFSQIALFASALSVGIGFGLQAIINNFVSGLILLIERPIKVGDWIAIGDLEGDVKAINIRATEIEMLDRSKLIVPNSDLISKTVRNVTHGASSARLRIMLRTDVGVDPATMRDLLMRRITAHPEILVQPAPAVFLSDVREGALEFTAFAYVASARSAYRVKSELMFQIVPDMRAQGITLASSTPVVNIGLSDRLIEPGAGSAG